jgi:isoleucyl-tRNA synthetase
VLDKRDDLKTHREVDGGKDRVMYLEGSDQHRGWFHSSLSGKLRHARARAL